MVICVHVKHVLCLHNTGFRLCFSMICDEVNCKHTVSVEYNAQNMFPINAKSVAFERKTCFMWTENLLCVMVKPVLPARHASCESPKPVLREHKICFTLVQNLPCLSVRPFLCERKVGFTWMQNLLWVNTILPSYKTQNLFHKDEKQVSFERETRFTWPKPALHVCKTWLPYHKTCFLFSMDAKPASREDRVNHLCPTRAFHTRVRLGWIAESQYSEQFI